MRKTCAEALSGPLSHLSPKLCENSARTTFAQFLRKKGGSRTIFAHFSESPETQAGSVTRTIFTQFSQPCAIFSKSAAVQDRDVSKTCVITYKNSVLTTLGFLGEHFVWDSPYFFKERAP